MHRNGGDLILPWEEERRKLPPLARGFFLVLGVAVLISIFINQCSTSDARPLAETPGYQEGAAEGFCR